MENLPRTKQQIQHNTIQHVNQYLVFLIKNFCLDVA